MKNNATRPVHYLGSKLRMLEAVKDAVDNIENTGGCICDLFSGSGTVSRYFLDYREVISVDIQQYSKILCEANMGYIENPPAVDEVISLIRNNNVTNMIVEGFGPLAVYEQECLQAAKDNKLEPLYEIIESGSLYTYLQNESTNLSKGLQKAIDLSYKRINRTEDLLLEDTMITRYFGGLYFSYYQTIQMDCIAHYVFEQEGMKKTKMLAALLSTASDLVNTVGKQFAQPLKVRNAKGELKKSLRKKILLDREEDVWEVYSKWLNYYFSIEPREYDYETICADYVDALELLKKKEVKVVYADPPYTRYHYSRYYHVLETICLRDNPNVSTTFAGGKGGISRAIYREGRHQSPFCIKSQAEEAFEVLFKKVADLQVPLVLSYSPFDESQAVTPRLQTIEQLVAKAEEYFDCVTVVSPGEFSHSKLNSTDKNFETNHEAELLIVCK